MGISVSKASTDDVARAIHKSVYRSMQNCGTSTTQNIIDIENLKNCSVSGITQYASDRTSCFAANVSDVQAKADIAKALVQLAKSQGSVGFGILSGGFLTFSEADVNNITEVVNTHYNRNEQTCTTALTQNVLNVHGCEESKVDDFNQIAKTTVDCVFKSQNVDTVLANITDTINNTAENKQLNVMGMFMIIAIVVVAVIIAIVYLLQPGHIDPALVQLATQAAETAAIV